jgi:hypothetical protein
MLEYDVNRPLSGGTIGIALFLADGTCVFASGDYDTHPELLRLREPGHYVTEVKLPAKWLGMGKYTVTVYMASAAGQTVYDRVEALAFDIIDTGTPGSQYGVNRLGILQPLLEWQTRRASL